MLVGRPRVRLAYIKPNTCLYPVRNKHCYKGLDFDNLKEELDTNKNFSSVVLQGVHCSSLANASNITLKYTDNAQLGKLFTKSCFNCKYSPGGYVLDIPRFNSSVYIYLQDYIDLCLAPLNAEIFNKYVDNSTRLIQLDFCFYSRFNDIFVRLTVAFEELDINRWWPSYHIHTGHFKGLFFRGNYHGVRDDVKVLLFPTLLLLVIVFRIFTEPKHHRWRRIILTLITLGFLIFKLYLEVDVVGRYDKFFNSEAVHNLTRLRKVEYMMEKEAHFPFSYLMEQEKLAKHVGIGLVLVAVLHISLYDNYYFTDVTLRMVGIRNAFIYSSPFLLYFLLLTFIFAVIGHSLFGLCMNFFSEKTESFIKLFQFQFLGDLDYTELMECSPGWGELYFYISSVVLIFVLFNFTFSYVFGVVDEGRRLKSREMMLEQHDDHLEKINWPVSRCHRGVGLSLHDQLRLVALLDFFSTQRKTNLHSSDVT